MHIFDPRFATSPHWRRQPPIADVSLYRQLQQRLGTSRAVVVNPSTYGVDNACLLDALDQLGDAARGVAVVDATVDNATLDQLAFRKVCGLRVNFVTAQSWGITTAEMLLTLASKVARLGWHIQVFVHPEQLVALMPVLQSLPVPLVIDHMARIPPDEGPDGAAFNALRRLLDGGNAWVKLSGVYMRSRVGGPNYDDLTELGTALIRSAPDRLVWGSDWPHTTEAPGTVNDAALVDVLRQWCGLVAQDNAGSGVDAVMKRILVDNPTKLYGFSMG